MSFSNYQFGPRETPKLLKYLIYFTLLISLFTAVTNHIIPYYLGWISPEQILSLSIWGIDHWYLWQFITYLFIQPIPNGISLSFLLSLAFNAYILWVIGVALIEKKGMRHFFTLYLLGGAFSGLIIYAFQSVTQSPLFFSGNSAALYSVLIAWLVLFPRAEFLLFAVVPIRASWLILGVLSVNILIDLSTGDLARVLAYLSAAGFGFTYSRYLLNKKEATPLYVRTKKFDFKTGKPILNDHEFMDEMLTKIALKGRSSLSWKERWRLFRIRKKRK